MVRPEQIRFLSDEVILLFSPWILIVYSYYTVIHSWVDCGVRGHLTRVYQNVAIRGEDVETLRDWSEFICLSVHREHTGHAMMVACTSKASASLLLLELGGH